MSRIEQFSIERAGAPLSEWTDALSTRIGHVPPSSWDERFTTCRTVGEVAFVGRIEHGDVGEITLAKVTTRTPHNLTMAQRDTSLPPFPMVLMFQMGGRCRVEQDGRACTLYSGDWCLLDTRHPSLIDALDSQNENLSLRLACPSDPETLSVLSNAAARRWSTGAGTPRILRATVAETFDQMNSLSNLGNRGLERAITALVWQAVREQLEQPVTSSHRDLQSAGAKRFIEARLQDPELSVDTIAQG